MGVTAGLKFAIPTNWAQQLADFILDGQGATIVGTTTPHFDISVIGREISRPGHAVGWAPQLFSALPRSVPRWQELQDFAAFIWGQPSPPRPPLLHHFHKADYVMLRQSAFTVTVKLTSNRSMNTECIAVENRRGRHLGQGTVYIYKQGDELKDMGPVLDWKGWGFVHSLAQHCQPCTLCFAVSSLQARTMLVPNYLDFLFCSLK